MKKMLLTTALLTAIVLAGCTNKKMEDQLISQKAMQDSIEAVLASKNAEVEMLFQQLNEIEESLTVVTSKYADVSKLKNKTGEVNADTRSRITAQIQDINEILNSNKQKVDQLNGHILIIRNDHIFNGDHIVIRRRFPGTESAEREYHHKRQEKCQCSFLFHLFCLLKN